MTIPVDPPRMVIQGLGGNRVSVNGKELSSSDWQTVRARDIFFFILEHPDGVSREKIEVNFWPEASSSQLKFTFKKTMYRLRRAFENDPILLNKDRYTFDYKGDYEYDVEELERALKQAERAAEETEKISALKMAVSIYKGTYLPEVDGLWTVDKREYFSRKYIEATRILGWHCFAKGDYLAVLSYCQALLAIDPGHEEAHRLAMKSHAARGSRSEVVKQFTLCKQALEKEYGLSPSKETIDLYKALTR
jgi:two-component SAPR family response regulator